jgi:hypothetical protein
VAPDFTKRRRNLILLAIGGPHLQTVFATGVK